MSSSFLTTTAIATLAGYAAARTAGTASSSNRGVPLLNCNFFSLLTQRKLRSLTSFLHLQASPFTGEIRRQLAAALNAASSSSSPIIPQENEQEEQVREVIAEIVRVTGVSEIESIEIASKSPEYAKMLMDSVRELDDLSLWSSWMNERELQGGERTEKLKEESSRLSLKKKLKSIAQDKADDGKIPYLESIGLSLSSASHIARLLSFLTLPSLIHKVKYVKEMFFSGSDDGRIIGKSARSMMLHLSISVNEDVQQTLSFFEKMEARRGGLEMLGSKDSSIRHLIESFPRLLFLSVESHMEPLVEFLKEIGVPRQCVGNVLLLFPPIIFLDIEKDFKPGIRAFQKVNTGGKSFGKMLYKYPWILSRSIQENFDEIFSSLESYKVPEVNIHRAITSFPLLLGCSSSKLTPMVEQFNQLGLKGNKLGKVIAKSPQLLLRKPQEFLKVVTFMQEVGFDKESIGKILGRCPEMFASSIDNTLQKKVKFLSSIGISKHHLPRVIKKYPELFVSDVDRTLLPRLNYLMDAGFSKRDIVSMISRFSPLLGYSIEEVLRPKLEFLVKTMEKPARDAVDYPRYFSYSLEKKIKPRFLVLKGRKVDCSLREMLAKNDDEFATEFMGIGRMFIPPR
ncbi:hypothetical protein Nepgr_005723 [Nepenthes gracilis]|uniref:Uncharacterized protein n=1 Tax=Nepenthes gracilis TaxID=150966 RepID=A0AAD3XGM9_NEPGR|nr:hypothetical protein Nepgr_005723 [Nepenthes gracilis]